ncbi:nucleotide sugar dehydrogenase [Paenibacillus sp. YN15]|uniref:nucleotide sugar dehydrogenase n=1 Tax=Paenibacillus sp. YN15 TaxID=1742774 RepID=UPI000DCEF5D8|nr:nucleotide sugar dehydrogenase [Paenibacillus sp. YN15]RAV00527.1 UDP-N-acetyl-D-glucosamine dehydrogenase [Paenibacillus sp. YN15]
MERIAGIEDGAAKVAVVGMGYVGLPLAVAIARAGYTVYGIDTDAGKVAKLQAGVSYILDVADAELSRWTACGALRPGTDYAVLGQADIAVLCVPTPLNGLREPDTSFIEEAVGQMVRYLRKGTLIILESTTYPGTTELLVRRRIEEEKGWQAGRDFYVSFSPERVDPGNRQFSLRSTPKVIGGSTPACLEVGRNFYAAVFERVVAVSSNEAAELAKLLENTFRSVNIALVNEMALLCERMGVSIWEVVEAAATKPFGFMPFYPGPGVGGHCIPVDPLYLSWKAGRMGVRLKFIELADELHRSMPERLAARIGALLEGEGKRLAGASIVLCGIAYKKDTDDIRESPALELMEHLLEKGARVVYHDPHVPVCQVNGTAWASQTAEPQLWAHADLVVIATDHTAVDYQQVADYAPLVFDTRNAARDCIGGRIVLFGGSGGRGGEGGGGGGQ